MAATLRLPVLTSISNNVRSGKRLFTLGKGGRVHHRGKGYQMLQVVYISSVSAGADTSAILPASRANNQRLGITGLLYCDGRRFMQVLEGPERDVDATYARIAADPRHRAPVVLSRRTIAAREFGDWAMAERRPGEEADIFVARVATLTAGASANVRATFDSFVQLRRAA